MHIYYYIDDYRELSNLHNTLVDLLSRNMVNAINPFIQLAILATNTTIEINHVLSMIQLEKFERSTLSQLIQSILQQAYTQNTNDIVNQQQLSYTVDLNNNNTIIDNSCTQNTVQCRDKLYLTLIDNSNNIDNSNDIITNENINSDIQFNNDNNVINNDSVVKIEVTEQKDNT